MTHGAGQAGPSGTGVLRVRPENIDRAVGELAGYGDRLGTAGQRLPFTGVAPASALPGGLAAKALALAAVTVGRATTTEGASVESAADSLRIFAEAVRTADSDSGESLCGVPEGAPEVAPRVTQP